MAGTSSPEWDLFIAHASEDKDGFVRPLAGRLEELGVKVWFDEFQLRPGDSLIGTIDRGLANSAFGLLILSRSFLEKPWPNYERQGLTTRELAGENHVLPVWRDVDYAEVADFSPPLADKFALTTSDVDMLAFEVLRVVRRDLFHDLSRRAAYEEYVQNLPVKRVPVARIDRDVPIRDHSLPRSLTRRLLLIHEATADVLPIPFEDTVLNFQRDSDLEDEAQTWELVAAIYLRIVRKDEVPPEGRKEVIGLALKASMRPLTEDDEVGLTYISVARFEEVRRELEKRLGMFN